MKSKIKIAIHGTRGRMGKMLIEQIKAEQNSFTLTSFLAADIIIDVSSPEGLEDLLLKIDGSQKVIIGTTGKLPSELISQYADRNTIVLVPNFSKGLRALNKSLQILSRELTADWSTSISDLHHAHKKDAPSGTAETFAKILGGAGLGPTAITSFREGSHIGEHTIIFKNRNETITIKHEVINRSVFSEGALEIAKWTMLQDKGIYSL